MIASPSASVVVTTTASHVAFDVNDPDDNGLMTEPRGYFTDQFEVLHDSFTICCMAEHMLL